MAWAKYGAMRSSFGPMLLHILREPDAVPLFDQKRGAL